MFEGPGDQQQQDDPSGGGRLDENDEDDGEGEGETLDNEYYNFLHVSRTASEAEISSAYKRLSRLFHPDKHTDPDKKKQAEILFNKLKKIYEGAVPKYICTYLERTLNIIYIFISLTHTT